MTEPKRVSDSRLEELRKFLVTPKPDETPRSPEEIGLLIRDMTWAIEELQIRRVTERVVVPLPKARPKLIFGKDEDVLAYVEKNKPEQWKQATESDITHAIPSMVQAIKLDSADPELWKKWEEVEQLYQQKHKAAS